MQSIHSRFPVSTLAVLALTALGMLGASARAQDETRGRNRPGERASAGAKQPDLNSDIQYIVFIIKENRSFDSYFGTYPGAYGATSGLISTGETIPLSHAGDRYPRDFNHSWSGLVQSVDHGHMDDFDLPVANPCTLNGDYLCYSQAYQQDLPNYWAYAQNYVLADEMFSSQPAPSYPQHLYAVAASSAGVINEPILPTGAAPGCDAPAGVVVQFLSASGTITDQYPCFDIPTLADSLNTAGISWGYYVGVGSYWNGYISIDHIRHSSYWTSNFFLPQEFVTAVEDGQLPAVSWVIANNAQSEHPGYGICEGENWTVEQINAIMNSPYWNNTAIFVTWDDPDGLYDHIPPPVEDEWGLGPRVPLLVISPYAKYAPGGYISHTVYEPASVLKFIEERFNLPYLSERDANANDLLDSFDFTQTPLPPLTLNTRSCPVLSQPATSFQPMQLGSTSPLRSILATNYGSTPMTISSIATTGDFGATNNCNGSLPANTNDPPDCTIKVSFTPTAAGPRTGTLTVVDSDPTSPQVVQLSGVGTNVVLSPSLLSFGIEMVGVASAPQMATLSNTGSAAVTINSITGTPDYPISSNCGSSIPGHGKCSITVVFAPTTSGKRYGALTVNTSDAGSPQIVNMTGVGTEVSLQPTSLSFGNQPLGSSSAPQTVMMTNEANTPLAISSITFSSQSGGAAGEATTDYAESNNCGSVLGAGATCTLTVTFNPGVLGSLEGTMIISDNFTDSPQQVALTGTGTASLNHSVPFIQPLAPPSAAPGSAAVALMVSGTGFVQGATIEWNGAPLTTTFRSAHSLTATVPATLLAQAGTARVTAVNPGPGGGASNVQFFSVANPRSAVTFTRTDIPVGTAPQGIVAGDFNGDGIEDLAVAASGANVISILLGNGNGTFTAQASPPTGRQPVSLAAGDFNNDGKLDLAAGNLQDNNVEVLLGNGDGTFTAAASVAGSVSPVSIVAGDFNQDGNLDVAVANDVEPEISILLGGGNGTLAPTSTPSGEGTDPSALAAGDYNGDGDLDLAEVNNVDLTLVALLGNGDGTFQTKGSPPGTGHNPFAIAAGDFNNDGHLDVAVVNQADGTISVFPGNGDGTFQAGQTFAAGASPSAISTADVNGDAKLDLLTAHSAANTISLWFGSGKGKFGSRKDYSTGSSPAGLAIADFNGDGLLDIAVTDSGASTISVMQQSPAGPSTVQPPPSSAARHAP
jgi:phospholipase C